MLAFIWQSCIAWNVQPTCTSRTTEIRQPGRQPVKVMMAAQPMELYDGLLHTYPVLTKCLTSATLFGVSDVIAQTAEAEPDQRGLSSISVSRVGRFMATGIGSGICWHHWFGFEQTVTNSVTAGLQSSRDIIVTRTVLGIVLEQFVMIPVYFSLYLIPVVSIQNGVFRQQMLCMSRFCRLLSAD